MKKELEDIRAALIDMDAYDEEAGEALASLEESIDEIDKHPAMARLRSLIEETAENVGDNSAGNSGGLSEKWGSLKTHVDEWEEHHPKVVLSVGKMAEALAVLGL